MRGPKVFHVSHFAPATIGHGGVHRTLQLQHDLQAVVGTSNVAAVNLELWSQSQREKGVRVVQSRVRRLRNRFASLRDNPFRLFSVPRYRTAIPFMTRGWIGPDFVTHYAELVCKETGPRVCIIEHVMFGEIVELNEQLGIPTVSVCQNLESLDVGRFDWRKRGAVYRVTTDLGNELRLLGRCAERLSMSKVEVGFLGGLGLECQYYPYVPVGPIRASLSAIRMRRARGAIEPGLVALLGSAAHGVTFDSMKWFVEAASEHGLPEGVRVVAAGTDTDKLLAGREMVPGLTLRGWIGQPELDDLLARAVVAVIPQRSGFGALTRLPELACAGVPVISFSHPVHAVNPPPGLRIVAPDWTEMSAALHQTLEARKSVTEDEYARWEAEQPRPLGRTLRRLIK
jgi:hypothetical protein